MAKIDEGGPYIPPPIPPPVPPQSITPQSSGTYQPTGGGYKTPASGNYTPPVYSPAPSYKPPTAPAPGSNPQYDKNLAMWQASMQQASQRYQPPDLNTRMNDLKGLVYSLGLQNEPNLNPYMIARAMMKSDGIAPKDWHANMADYLAPFQGAINQGDRPLYGLAAYGSQISGAGSLPLPPSAPARKGGGGGGGGGGNPATSGMTIRTTSGLRRADYNQSEDSYLQGYNPHFVAVGNNSYF